MVPIALPLLAVAKKISCMGSVSLWNTPTEMTAYHWHKRWELRRQDQHKAQQTSHGPPPPFSLISKNMPRFKFGGAPKCSVCTKSVYQMELIKWDEKSYHKSCFRCLNCKKALQPKSVAMMSGDLYCKGCFKKKFRERGRYDDITTVIPGMQNRGDRSVSAPAKPLKRRGSVADKIATFASKSPQIKLNKKPSVVKSSPRTSKVKVIKGKKGVGNLAKKFGSLRRGSSFRRSSINEAKTKQIVDTKNSCFSLGGLRVSPIKAFTVSESPVPIELKEGEVMVELTSIRISLDSEKSPDGWKIQVKNKQIVGEAKGVVIKSKNSKFQQGVKVYGSMPWQSINVVTGDMIEIMEEKQG
ncbi:hypothetical protein AAMO2058_000392300 [Amorphochlora amoebiformis]